MGNDGHPGAFRGTQQKIGASSGVLTHRHVRRSLRGACGSTDGSDPSISYKVGGLVAHLGSTRLMLAQVRAGQIVAPRTHSLGRC